MCPTQKQTIKGSSPPKILKPVTTLLSTWTPDTPRCLIWRGKVTSLQELSRSSIGLKVCQRLSSSMFLAWRSWQNLPLFRTGDWFQKYEEQSRLWQQCAWRKANLRALKLCLVSKKLYKRDKMPSAGASWANKLKRRINKASFHKLNNKLADRPNLPTRAAKSFKTNQRI